MLPHKYKHQLNLININRPHVLKIFKNNLLENIMLNNYDNLKTDP